MAKLVSQTYGEALFEVAVEENMMDSLYDEVIAVLTVFQENEEYIKLLNYPKLPMEEKISLLEQAFKGKVCDHLLGLMVTVAEKRRFSEVESILNYFVEKVREYKKIGTAYVTSAAALSDAEKSAIEKKLLETTEYQSFLMNYRVDRELIGGMTIRIGDRVVDSSIRTKLANMAKELSRLQLTK